MSTPYKGKIFIVFLLVLFFYLNKTNSQISFENAFPALSFNFPVEIQNSQDGTNRLFIVEQTGKIKVFPVSSSITEGDVSTFIDLSSKISYNSGEEIGLLGLAFHPNFSSNKYIFVYYIDRPDNYRINIVRYQVSSTYDNIVDMSSEFIIAQFTKNQLDSNHNGGKIAFGPDGYLYISIGDGGGQGDPEGNGQNLESIFGNILRIDIDIDGSNPIESNPNLPNNRYEIPADNPRVNTSGLEEIFAWGFRNTWKFSFDSNIIWGGDVGQDNLEEINIIQKGGNYGWNRFEGNSIEDASTNLITSPHIEPVFTYDHNNGDVSITGGYVYRGSISNTAIQGKYIYGDYASGRVWALSHNILDNTATSEFLFRTNGQFISSFGLDEAGELYFSDYGSSVGIYKISGTSSGPVTLAVNGIGSWNNLESGVNGIIERVINDGNDTYYIGGEFTNSGGTNVSNLATYNASTGWDVFGNGTNGKVNDIAIANNGDVYIGGDFSQVDGVSATNIAVWNGSNWSPLGTGTNGPVAKIGIDGNDRVYVGGAFETADGVTVNNIALWENDNWSPLTDSGNNISGTNNEIRAIAFDENNNLYVGGNFDLAGGNSAPRIAVWDRNSWGTLGLGTSGFVQAIAINSDYIYAGGNFAIAGSQTVNRIARWNRNTNTWEALNNGLSGNVNSLVLDKSYIYAGGSFETASDLMDINEIMNNVARWSENDGWEAMGTNTSVGVDIRVNSLVFSNDNTLLFTGGNFSNAGQTTASNIAIWSLSPIAQDDDNDGVNNDVDQCPNTPNGVSVDAFGCEQGNNDGDKDGVTNDIDQCPNTSSGEIANSNGCSQSQLDDDNDGVTNDLDLCPSTPIDTEVDSFGCPVPAIPADNFTISTVGLTCIRANDGQINIEAELVLDYQALLTGNSVNNLTLSFTQNLNIPDLAAGSYNMCITESNNPDFQSCYTIVLTEPEALNVTSSIDYMTNLISLQMAGGNQYSISLNGESFTTMEDEIELELTEKVNSLSISTEKSCQGNYEETILISEDIQVYPNPFENSIYIHLNNSANLRVELNLFAMSGERLFSEKVDIVNGQIEVPMYNLPNGIYLLSIINKSNTQTFKLLKK